MRPRIFSRLVPVLLASSFLALASGSLAAENTRFSDRGDRDEGVITTQEISGGYFSLTGLQIENDAEALTSPARLAVTYWLPEAERPAIKVWMPQQNYWMVPHRRELEAGEQTFSWPVAPVIKPLGVDVSRLQVLITNEDQTLYYPARLQANTAPGGESGYVFLFVSSGGVFLHASIARVTDRGLIVVRSFDVQEDFPGNVRIRWNGRNADGDPAPAGTYHLRLQGEIWLANKDDSLSIDVPFVHRGTAN